MRHKVYLTALTIVAIFGLALLSSANAQVSAQAADSETIVSPQTVETVHFSEENRATTPPTDLLGNMFRKSVSVKSALVVQKYIEPTETAPKAADTQQSE
jgi:hypothetical protein